MPYALSILRVEDYAKWKSAFDSKDGIALHKAFDMKSYLLFQTGEDHNNLVLLTEWDNLDKARKFMQSEELRVASQQSGVMGGPDNYFLEEVEKRSV
ncbi:MAG TPA: cyclase [Methanophagales archaeon]|nr:cyclase [Methanophagales archaeon]